MLRLRRVRMIRLARRASLLIAFCLLTSAATAYAECAWVLWKSAIAVSFVPAQGPSPGMVAAPTWEPRGAYDTKDRCEISLTAEHKQLTADGQQKAPKLVCLPDTVDPRG